MSIGPVQILVIGFDDPKFTGEILEELSRLKENDVIRLVDLLVVEKTRPENIERMTQRSLG